MSQQYNSLQASIVVAVDENLPDLQSWFRALCAQTVPAEYHEIIITDASHQTDYESALAQFRAENEVQVAIRCERVPRGGRARALNRALETATGNIIIFLGDDCLPAPDFVEAHLRFHEQHPEEEAVGAGSALFPPELETPFTVWLQESGRLFGVPLRSNLTEVPEEFFYVANASVKRTLLDRAGRFDERFAADAWDDFEFGGRLRAAGMRAKLVPDASVQHVHSIDLHDREQTMRIAGAAAKVYATIYPGTHPWSKLVNSSPRWHWLRIKAAHTRMMIKRNDGAVVNWWQSRLDAAFSAGYRECAFGASAPASLASVSSSEDSGNSRAENNG